MGITEELICDRSILEKKVDKLENELVNTEARLNIALEALEHYAARMDDGGTARKALKQICPNRE